MCFKRWWSFCCCTCFFVSKDDVSHVFCWAPAIARCYSLQSTSLQPGVPKHNSTTCQGFLAYHAITQQPRCGQIMLIKMFVCHVGEKIRWIGHPIFYSNICSHFWECTMYPGHLGRLAIWHLSVFLGASTHPWVSADIVVGLLRQRLLDERTIRLGSSGSNVLCNVLIAHQEQFSRNQNQPCFGHVFDKIGVYNVDKELGTWNLKWVVGTDRKVLGASEIGKKWKRNALHIASEQATSCKNQDVGFSSKWCVFQQNIRCAKWIFIYVSGFFKATPVNVLYLCKSYLKINMNVCLFLWWILSFVLNVKNW